MVATFILQACVFVIFNYSHENISLTNIGRGVIIIM